MANFLSSYGNAMGAWVAMGGLLLVQALVADITGVRAKHTPGMPVATGHSDALFRAVRAHANTLENVPAFLLLSLSCMMLGAAPKAVSVFAWAFVAARVVHMGAYYADLRTVRSAAFGVSFVALLGLLVVALRA
jgi:uncharacterized MAPEG superfamily protein